MATGNTIQIAQPTPDLLSRYNAALVLADGTVFLGQGVGAQGEALGELCFNTSLTGYQEIITDPSYAGQIITFTFPHIGNVGCNEEDNESRAAFAKGIILREPVSNPSNYRSQGHLHPWLVERNVVGISGVDTRRLTRHLREHGAQNACLVHLESLAHVDFAKLQQSALAHIDLSGLDLAKEVTTPNNYTWKQRTWLHGQGYHDHTSPQYHVVAIDYGEKLNILRCLSEVDCRVTVVPARTSAEDILALNPDGVFLSNGPADPAATTGYSVATVRGLIGAGVPIFGICLGHQILALAVGAKTKKMHQGHRGANHPVKNLETGAVEITSQNHGFVVDPATLPANAKVTHVSLFDGTLEGFRLTDKPVFCVQYHPEASPGPHDSFYLFEQFVAVMEESKSTRVPSSVKKVAG